MPISDPHTFPPPKLLIFRNTFPRTVEPSRSTSIDPRGLPVRGARRCDTDESAPCCIFLASVRKASSNAAATRTKSSHGGISRCSNLTSAVLFWALKRKAYLTLRSHEPCVRSKSTTPAMAAESTTQD